MLIHSMLSSMVETRVDFIRGLHYSGVSTCLFILEDCCCILYVYVCVCEYYLFIFLSFYLSLYLSNALLVLSVTCYLFWK